MLYASETPVVNKVFVSMDVKCPVFEQLVQIVWGLRYFWTNPKLEPFCFAFHILFIVLSEVLYVPHHDILINSLLFFPSHLAEDLIKHRDVKRSFEKGASWACSLLAGLRGMSVEAAGCSSTEPQAELCSRGIMKPFRDTDTSSYGGNAPFHTGLVSPSAWGLGVPPGRSWLRASSPWCSHTSGFSVCPWGGSAETRIKSRLGAVI